MNLQRTVPVSLADITVDLVGQNAKEDTHVNMPILLDAERFTKRGCHTEAATGFLSNSDFDEPQSCRTFEAT